MPRLPRVRRALALGGLGLALAAAAPLAAEEPPPDVLLLSVDTLRADHLGAFGYHRDTSPTIDALVARGALFTQARTVEPLTAPALASMITSLHPHEHGSTRNGLRVRPNLASFTRLLGRRGYRTAAVVGNWTLRERLSGLDEHFETYVSLLTKKRWFGLAKREATADDLNREALDWLDAHLEESPRRPFLLWVHYVEPHAPYHLRADFLEQVGVKKTASFFSATRRYDTEIAYVDDRIGRLLEEVGERIDLDRAITVFVADHGESLGDHGYWGHGRHLYDASLHIPMAVVWPERVAPRRIAEPALIVDLAPTLLTLAGLPAPPHFRGFDWAPALTGGGQGPAGRETYFQAHRASVEPTEEQVRLRQRGLLEVGRMVDGVKEIYRLPNQRRRIFDTAGDPRERASRIEPQTPPSAELATWLEEVRQGLATSDDLPPPTISEEDLEALRALGYID